MVFLLNEIHIHVRLWFVWAECLDNVGVLLKPCTLLNDSIYAIVRTYVFIVRFFVVCRVIPCILVCESFCTIICILLCEFMCFIVRVYVFHCASKCVLLLEFMCFVARVYVFVVRAYVFCCASLCVLLCEYMCFVARVYVFYCASLCILLCDFIELQPVF